MAEDERKTKEEAVNIYRKRVDEETSQIKERKELGQLQEGLKKAKEAEDDERQASDKLIDEANLKLKSALKKGDLKTAKIAQGMLEGAHSMGFRAKDLYLKNR